MPYLKEEDLVKLYDEVDQLKEEKKQLQQGYIDLKLSSKKTEDQGNIIKVAAAVLVVLLLLLSYYFYAQQKEAQAQVEQKTTDIEELNTVISQLQAEEPIENVLTYSIQIGAFKKVNLLKGDTTVANFKQMRKVGLNAYLIGMFDSYKEATAFKKKVRRLGMRDAFVVAYKGTDKIHIREALKMSKETQYLGK